MRYLVLSVSLSLLGLAACGEEEVAVKYNCQCVIQCDAVTVTEPFTGCELPSKAQAALQEAVTECSAYLQSEGCVSSNCNCQCAPTETECTP